MCGLREEKDIKEVEADRSGRGSGMTCRALRDREAVAETVVVSVRTTLEQERIILAHELAHGVARTAEGSETTAENAMNRFAGAFLVPPVISSNGSASGVAAHLPGDHPPQAHLWDTGSPVTATTCRPLDEMATS